MAVAAAAGLGWQGKSTILIHRGAGTWLFLGVILTTLELEATTAKEPDRCGSCTRFIDACPTAAIIAPYQMDARKCLAYLTIEHKGAIPVEYREALGDRVFGCDDCLDACPWNRFAQVSREASLHARPGLFDHRLRDFLALDLEQFRALFAKSPIKRIKRDRFLRNVCVALGNTGDQDDLPALYATAHNEASLVTEHAQWAIGEINERVQATPYN